ncbi:MAG: hypothetical protein II527_01025 [Bacteroidales bacterium]|nr:hypothetical protein [Bacteroidales bacterium]MBQ2482730.1 hypothetical protein [Bacteroidales bacterium]MBQ2491898.1 hypothetical protein [Bacteroidales bacterium]
MFCSCLEPKTERERKLHRRPQDSGASYNQNKGIYILRATIKHRTIPIGTAYPVWTGIGAVGTVLVGIFVFNEVASFWRLFFITTLIISIVGLKVLS